MAKIFDVQDWLKNHPNRNNFDLTHKVHGSYKMGTLYPIMCKPVVPTDSFKIDTAVSLRFTPMPFPTQSNMRVIFHYFYVRTKNIWKNFPNWLQGLEEHTPPYIMQGDSFYRDGKLADHLDIPTSFHSVTEDFSVDYNLLFGDSLNGETNVSEPLNIVVSSIQLGNLVSFSSYNSTSQRRVYIPVVDSDRREVKFNRRPKSISLNEVHFNTSNSGIFISNGNIYNGWIVYLFKKMGDNSYLVVDNGTVVYNGSFERMNILWANNQVFDYINDDGTFKSQFEDLFLYFCHDVQQSAVPAVGSALAAPFDVTAFSCYFTINGRSSQIGDGNTVNPYFSTNNQTENSIKISALPFRAYESIYNAFYRNSQGVQPFVVNGQTKYNQYVTTDEDGADTTPYTLMKRNWELDAYTSCLISPQQGNVPYVGITEVSALGRMTVETPDGETASVRLTDNGDGVEITNLHGDSQESRAYALRAASSGFTIPEFRECNSLQRFLEMNIRKGYKYIDFIEGHFGKKPTYAEMDMPEFIGGFSQRISVNEISNTNGVSTDTLGAIAGQARAIGGSKHGINHYFDDFGFVVGIMCIVPDNAYDCVLPKHYNLLNPLDMYFPEFSQLSYMPLTHEELAPIQTINDPRGSSYRTLSKVFGYQRPNHDLVWYPDTVHGLFRDATGIGNSVICRRFASRPDLSDNFLTIKPEETDTIFNYMFGDQDIALGEIVLNISAKRPIPRLVVPQIS